MDRGWPVDIPLRGRRGTQRGVVCSQPLRRERRRGGGHGHPARQPDGLLQPGPGSFWQVPTNLELISNLMDLAMPLQAAIDAPRWTMGGQTSWSDSSLNLEARFGDTAIRDLAPGASSATDAPHGEVLVFAESRCYKSQVTAAGRHPPEPRANSASRIRGRKNASEEEILD